MSRHSHTRDMVGDAPSGPTSTASSSWRDAPTLAGAVLCLLLLIAFFAVPYLPMVDLPQHAAQISIWLHLHDPAFPEAKLFELNLTTPYLGAYALARGLAGWVGVLPALKLVVWLSIVGHWAAFSWLVRLRGFTPWLGLLGVPFAMGYGFYFGFISFIGALPFGLAAACLALIHRERASLQSGLLLGAALCATLATHGFALGLSTVLVVPLLLRGKGTLITRGAPLLAPALLIAVWLVPGSSAKAIGYTIWDPRFVALTEVPGLMLASSGADAFASTAGLVMFGLLTFTLGRPCREPERWLPLAVLFLGYCLFPLSFGGFTPLHPRFVAFMVPAVLLAFEPPLQPRLTRMPLRFAFVTVIWFGVFVFRLHQFAQEIAPVQAFVERMPRGLRVRPLVFERNSQAFPGLPAMIHVSAYYVPEKAGWQGYSFAQYPTSVIRYVPGFEASMRGGSEWHPEWFSAPAELDAYDCFFVKSSRDLALELFGERRTEMTLAFQSGGFWAYLTRTAPSAHGESEAETAREHSMVASSSN